MPKKTSGAKKKAKLEKKQHKKANPKLKIDLTFGLKNKKGKKNRQFVRNAKANMNADENQKRKKRYEQKLEKQRQKAWEREQALIYKNVDDDPQFKNKRKYKKNIEIEEEIKIEVDDETLLNNATPEELDGLIDKLRVKFDIYPDSDYNNNNNSNIVSVKLTPCNSETFFIWLEKWEQEKENERTLKLNKKLKRKKGKSKLTGRELFTYDKSVFVDDENAQNEYIYENDLDGNENKEEENKNDDQVLNGSKHKASSKMEDNIANVDDIQNADLFLNMNLEESEILDID